MEGTSCSPASRTNGLKLQERSIKLCNTETWGTDCLGRLQSLHNFSREQFRLLSLTPRRQTGTVSATLGPEERPYNVMKSLGATAWKRLQTAHKSSSSQQPPLWSIYMSPALLPPPSVFDQPQRVVLNLSFLRE